jgi:hypothetical protein
VTAMVVPAVTAVVVPAVTAVVVTGKPLPER